MELGHVESAQAVLDYFQTDFDRGLTDEQVRKNQERYGLNGN